MWWRQELVGVEWLLVGVKGGLEGGAGWGIAGASLDGGLVEGECE